MTEPEPEDDEVARVRKLFRFLQGEVPEGWRIRHPPRLKPRQAWAVIYYLQEGPMVFSDYIERCDDCGEIFDSRREGRYFEKTGNHYCEECQYSHDEEADPE